MLPAGWKVARIDEISSLVTSGARNWAQYYSESGSLFIRMMNLMRDSISLNLDSIQYVDVRGISEAKRTRVESGDILLSITAELGKVSFVKQLEEDAYISQHVAIVRILPQKANPCYIAYVISSKEFNKKLQKLNDAGAKAGLNLPTIRGLSFTLPPLAEQKKIAEILSTWDEAISVVDKQLENCRQQKKALMQQLLTGKKRLPGFSGEWKAKRLSSFCKRITERNNGHCSLVATISAQYGLIRQEEFFNKSVASETLDNYFLLRKGDFAYNKSYSLGYPMGAIKRLNRYQEAVVTSLYICFRLDETKADSDYFEFFFDSGLLDKPLTQIAAEGGRAHGLLNVRPDDFMGIQILFPPLEEQKAIASVLSTSARQIEMLEQKLNALQEEKKSLMQQLLTGKKRVAVEE